MNDAKLELFRTEFSESWWSWRLVCKSFYVETIEAGYVKKANAKRAAENTAKRLGLKIVRTETET